MKSIAGVHKEDRQVFWKVTREVVCFYKTRKHTAVKVIG